MKKALFAILMLCALCFALPAMAADTKEEWNASCNWVITSDATLYTATVSDDVTTATDLYEYTPVGTIAAGSRVSIRSSSGGMREISYWNGGVRSGWVQDSYVRWAAASTEEVEAGTTTGGKKAQSSGLWEDFPVKLAREDGTVVTVTLEELGTAQCVVFDGEEMLTVATESLSWDTEAPEDKAMAVIYAPRTGKCTLRASASNSAKAIGQCEAGKIVIVLKVGKVYTRILYDGKEGCVLNSTLTFSPVVSADEYTTAMLSYQGRTDSSATISMYTATDAERKLDQFRVGNEVVVLGEKGTWTEIEIDGLHGFVKTKYLD
ncbi:MAG: hypothetical protein IJ438_10710 [Clostridia bacterium]|nr:hypothetical protein [Clostridia bacterium]